jgi:plasmid maintenance system antidote protein VapI
MSKRKLNMVDVLRKAAKDSGQTTYALAKGSGVDRAAVVRFLNNDRGLNLDSAARLAAYLGWELRPVRKAGK